MRIRTGPFDSLTFLIREGPEQLCCRITAGWPFGRDLMKRLATFLLLGALGIGCSVATSAQTRTSTMSESRASQKANKKQQKAMKKYAKAQRKAERKMLKTERKNTKYPPRQF